MHWFLNTSFPATAIAFDFRYGQQIIENFLAIGTWQTAAASKQVPGTPLERAIGMIERRLCFWSRASSVNCSFPAWRHREGFASMLAG